MPPPPPKPTSLTPDSPFGGAGGTPAGAINPYASAASVGPAYAPQYYWGGPRPGLPWENERQTIGCWFKTTGVLIGSPTQAFSLMRREGGLGTPILYAIYGMGLPVIAAAMVITPIGLVIALVAGGDDKLNIAAAVLGLSLAITAAVAVWLVIEATLFTIIRAAFLHLMLLIVGGGRHGFETTFRVVSYTRGSLFWCILIPIPYLNLMIMGIWSLVILIIGLSRAHEISGGKAALAIFLPAIAVIGLMLVALVVALLAGVGAAAFSR